jgi:hypothetical protein
MLKMKQNHHLVVDILIPEKSYLVWCFGVFRTAGRSGRPGITLVPIGMIRNYGVITRHNTIIQTLEIAQPFSEPSINYLILLDIFGTSQYINSSS